VAEDRFDLIHREAGDLRQHVRGADTELRNGVRDPLCVGVLDLFQQDAMHGGLIGPHALVRGFSVSSSEGECLAN
jgi:hypothetical protein